MYTFEFAEDQDRAIARADDGEEVGEATIIREDGYWDITHTGVDPAHRGQQLAARLIETVVMAAKEAGVKLKPTCPYAARALEGNPHYADLIYKG